MVATCTHCKMPVPGLVVKSSMMMVMANSEEKMIYYPGMRMCFKCPECMEVLFYSEEKAKNFLLEIPPPAKKPRGNTTSKW